MDWDFRQPLFLFAVLLAPLVWMWASRLPAAVTYSSLALMDTAPASWRSRLGGLPPLALALAVVALAIALSGPRTGDAQSRESREGIAIVMVVDRSGSMEARDFVSGDTSRSRLDAVKRVFRDFISRSSRDNDLVGLVSFARYADGLCPLTLDRGNLLTVLDDLEIVDETNEDGTAVGQGLALAVERLRRQDSPSKVVILLTDGVNNAGSIDPLQAADLAAQFDVKVYTIGAGKTGYAPFPVDLPDGGKGLWRSFVEIDEETLAAIAEKTGGRYFHAADTQALEQVIDEIDRLERGEINEIRYVETEPHYAVFAVAALVLMALAALLSATVLRRLPG